MNSILLCEKSEVFKDALLQIILRKYPGLDFKWVLTGEQCLAETGNFNPDIVILGANVYEGENKMNILRELRENFPAMNIILFTDYGIEEYVREATVKGANYTISKESWTGNELLNLISKILAQSSSVNSHPDVKLN